MPQTTAVQRKVPRPEKAATVLFISYPYSHDNVRKAVDVSATITAKGQVTIPKQVRDELGLREGDRVLFRVVDGRAILARTPDLLDLAGAVPVPADVRNLEWSEVRARAHAAQAARSL